MNRYWTDAANETDCDYGIPADAPLLIPGQIVRHDGGTMFHVVDSNNAENNRSFDSFEDAELYGCRLLDIYDPNGEGIADGSVYFTES